jgi:hypothetical protein
MYTASAPGRSTMTAEFMPTAIGIDGSAASVARSSRLRFAAWIKATGFAHADHVTWSGAQAVKHSSLSVTSRVLSSRREYSGVGGARIH